MKGRGFARLVGLLGLLVGVGALAFGGVAQAKFIRKPLGPFGSAEQPSFAGLAGLAVDQSSGNLYVLDSGRLESQAVKVSATAGQFRLKFKGETTVDIAYNAPAREKPDSVQTALEALPSIGAGNVFVVEGPGDASGSHPYVIAFQKALAHTDLEQLTCENGTTPLSGGSGCSVTTVEDGEPVQVTRWNADGTPSSFSALGSNAIDGKGPGEDQTPDNTLDGASYIAIDESGGATDGDIYVARQSKHVLEAFAPSGKYLGQLTGFKEGPNAEGPLKFFSADSTNAICGVTVDQAGDLYVGETTVSGGKAHLAIHKYQPTANPVVNADNVANFAVSSLNTNSCRLAAGAGPTVGYIFASGSESGASPGVFKLNATTGADQYAFAVKGSEGKEPPLEFVSAIAVDPASGYVFAGSGNTSGQVLEYDASGSKSPLPRYSFGVANQVAGLAADATSGNLYVARNSIPQIDVYGPVLILPDVVTEAATEVAGTSASLNGTISAASGPSASCHFQYTTETAYLADTAIEGHDGFAGAQSASCEPAGPFTGSVTNAVSAEVSGLSPETKYRFRIVGENENGENQGEAKGLETLGKPAIEGGIASEVTTAKAKVSGKVNPRGLATEYAVQYVTQADFEASGYASATTVLGATKATGTGFAEVSVQLSGLQPGTTYHFRLIASNEAGTATPGEDKTFATFVEATGLPDGRAYEQVSPTVKLGEVFPSIGNGKGDITVGTCTACVPGWPKPRMPMQVSPDGNAVAYEGMPFSEGLASGANQYIANRGSGGWATTPLSRPEFQDTLGVGFKAFSADLSRGVLSQLEPSLSPDAPANYADLYLWQTGGALTPLITTEPPNKLPQGVPDPEDKVFRVTYAGANAGTPSKQAFSHLVFQANDTLTPEVPGIAPEAPSVVKRETDLYEWTGGQLHLVNVLPGNNAASPNAVIGSGNLLSSTGVLPSDFDHAISNDGSRIFWSQKSSGQVYVREGGTTTVKVPDPGKFLTATADGSKVLLSNGHVFNLEDESTTDLTGGQGGFQGTLGTSEDFSRVYFVDTEALTPPTEENANGEAAEEGEFNLYLVEGGAAIFIGILQAKDNFIEIRGTWRPSPADRTAQVSPDGRYLAFQSIASLADYDNRYRDAKEGAESCGLDHSGSRPECFEVFEYDAETGNLTCPSCNPTGQRPLGPSHLTLIDNYPESFPQPHNLPDEGHGRLFFESQDNLSAADKNGVIQDVYEWEPDGVGDCQLPRGCITLISGGNGPEDSYFLDASPNGDDAFFTTWDQLVPFDKDDLMDLYDARAAGGFEFSAQEPCLGKACRGASSSASEQQSPGTAGFSEAVSTPKSACGKGSVKKRGRCVSKKKKKHHHKRAAKHNRGGAK
jgi:hypothetical protein